MPLVRMRSSPPPERPLSSRDFEVVEGDGWARVLDDGPLPRQDADVVVSRARLEAEHEALARRAGRVGARIPNDQPLDGLVPHLARLARLEIPFPKFTDGRGYSIARRLREAHGYRGEIVAVGDVLRDQLLHMLRCGFSAFELAPGVQPGSVLAAFDEQSVRYQAAADEPQPLYARARRPRAS